MSTQDNLQKAEATSSAEKMQGKLEAAQREITELGFKLEGEKGAANTYERIAREKQVALATALELLEEAETERDRWFLFASSMVDAVDDSCDRGYCVLADADCQQAQESCKEAVRAALNG